jgi:hypothetical protein
MRARRNPAPIQREDETDINYIVRVVNYLAEPQRRRLGVETRDQVVEAAKRLEQMADV